MRAFVGGVTCVLVVARMATAAAQDPAPADDGSEGDTTPAESYSRPDYTIPTAPAFTFLGTSPSNIEQPSSSRDLGVALLNGIDQDGKVKQGFALTFRPWKVWRPYALPLGLYKANSARSFLARLYYNLEVSVGTVKTASEMADSASTSAAVGARITLVDRADPLRDATYTAAINDVIEGCVPSGPGGDADAQLKCMADKAKELKVRQEDFRKEHWNATRLQAAFAVGSVMPASNFEDMDFAGMSAWLVGATPFWDQDVLHAVFQLQYDRRKAPEKRSDLVYGSRIVVGTARTTGFVELTGLYRLEPADMQDASEYHWSAGVDFRIRESTWLAIGFGDTFGDEGASSLFADLKWATSAEDRFAGLRTP